MIKLILSIMFLFIFLNAKAPEEYTKAYNFYKSKNYDESISTFNEFIKSNPDDFYVGNCYFWLGIIESERGNPDKAIENFQLVLKSENKWKYADAHSQLISIFSKTNNNDEMLKSLKAIKELRAQDANMVSDIVYNNAIKKLEAIEIDSENQKPKTDKEGITQTQKDNSLNEKDKDLENLLAKSDSIEDSLSVLNKELRYEKQVLDNYETLKKAKESELGGKDTIKTQTESNIVNASDKTNENENNDYIPEDDNNMIADEFDNLDKEIYKTYNNAKTKIPDLKGKLVVKLELGTTGNVKLVKVIESKWNHKSGYSLEKILKKKMFDWKVSPENPAVKKGEIDREYLFK
ncbi:MAG: hypothetical protein JXR48_16315 [Candidatus Delongbacteria bacterium]|nr:hypothetical protein [Candidatus Delongbacteria bacterium]MBN2836522.1 hypothetical protein [Candidatus Delongbacteria bacterium]